MNCKAATNRKGVNTIMTKTRRRKNCQQLKICNILEMMQSPKWWFLGVFRDPSGLGIVISVYKRVQTFLDLNTPQRKVENPSELDVKEVSQSEIDNSKLGSTQQQKICWHWHVARIISSQKIYGFYGLKHHIVEIRGCVTDAGQTTNQPTKDWR